MQEIIGERLKQIRKKLKKTRVEVANEMNIAISTLYRWEKGERLPRRENIAELASYYGVSEKWLLGQTNSLAEGTRTEIIPVDRKDLYRMRGECLWLDDGTCGRWVLVSEKEDMIYLPDGERVPFYKITGTLLRYPSPMCFGLDALGKPIPRSRLLDYEKVWVEEIGAGPAVRKRGWFTLSDDKNSFEDADGNAYKIGDYGIKWAAFEDLG